MRTHVHDMMALPPERGDLILIAIAIACIALGLWL